MARLYDTDMAAWSEQTAQLLAEGRHDELDVEALLIPIASLPDQCPWALEQVLDAAFWPTPGGSRP